MPINFDAVAARERSTINRRRNAVFGVSLGVEDLPEAGKPDGDESSTPQLPAGTTVGLALSGGGIRSATFNLGVLQVLARMKFWNRSAAPEPGRNGDGKSLLDRVDYLSTVSGGGYIGSWLVASYLRAPDTGNPEEHATAGKAPVPSPAFLGETSEALHHLRSFSRYLAPEAGMMNPDTWTVATIWARNTLLMQMMIFCCMVSLLLLKRFGAELFCVLASGTGMEMQGAWRSPTWWGLLLLGTACVVYALKFLGKELSDFGKPGESQKALDQKSVVKHVVLPLLGASWCLGLALWTGYFAIHGPLSGMVTWVLRQEHLPATWNLIVTAVVFGLFGAVLAYFAMSRTEKRLRHRLVGLAFLGGLVVVFGVLFSLDKGLKSIADPAHGTHHSTAGIETGNGHAANATSGTGDMTVVMNVNEGLDSGQVERRLTLGPVKVGVSKTPDRMIPTDVLFNVLRCHLGLVLLTALLFMVTIIVGLMGRSMRDDVREWLSRLAAWLWILGFGWLCLHLLALMVPRMVFKLPPFDHYLEGLHFGTAVWTFAAWLLTTVMGTLAANSPQTGDRKSNPPLMLGILARFGPYAALGGLLVLASLATYLVRAKSDPLLSAYPLQTAACLVVVASLAWVLLRRVDLNEFSMHHFYRNRLVRCYLGASRVMRDKQDRRHPHPFTGFDFDDDLPLARLASHDNYGDACYHGPYPIIAATLNSSAGGDLATQDRHAEAFVFTPDHVGITFARPVLRDGIGRGGYRETWRYANAESSEVPLGNNGRQSGNQQRHGLSLGTCLSISGAAVSPNCGYHTSPVAAFLLTVANARLGWWLPNPWRPTPKNGAEPAGPCKWLGPLVSELTGTVSAQGLFIHTSDGGHFENLGIYELVRRRCGLIIVSDVEEDGNYEFFGLGTAIRQCRVDFDTEIEIDLTAIRTTSGDDPGCRQAHCAIGRIIYPDDPERNLPRSEGVIVYLKSSLTGDEPEDIRQYRTVSPAFPHDPTANQFFTASEFESYRRLGEHVAKEALEMPWNRHNRSPDSIPGFAEDLLAPERHGHDSPSVPGS